MSNCHIALLEAVHMGDSSRVVNLLHEGCEQAVIDSALCWASRYGNIEILRHLLRTGGDPNARVWGGFTPLLWAVMYSSNADVIQILLQAESNVDHSSSRYRQTALHAAVIRGNEKFASLLLEAGANPDVQDRMFKTPLLHAVQKYQPSCVALLIKYNCNVDLSGWVTGLSTTPLTLALIQGDLEITKMLLLAGAKFNNPAVYHSYTIAQYYKTVEDNLDIEVRPVYLQQQCRVCIRQLLKPHFLQKLRELTLPRPLKGFLEISELDSVNESMA
ncbi:ankyrin repeat and SOCS box protein 11-like [Saccostrea echinata]|uniref:ankyrin repeat and SOCS box protein 11-like n=1 Tax=Saccostrea echinata TaxID=191078 RepID=UPI002A7F0478|nr:ankyrin repeat and SOCS box protein 11-like [Saccostrea echinata]